MPNGTGLSFFDRMSMTSQMHFYRERAAEARAGADAATLANIRDRWLLAEATWMQLADRSARAEQSRQPRVGMLAPSEAGAL